MSKQYFPGANTTIQNFQKKYGGSKMNTNVMVIHSTEGLNWPGYGGGGSAPNMTIFFDLKKKQMFVRQHFAADVSARALQNRAGGVQTNTANVFQIELIGTCDSRYRLTWNGLRAGIDYIYWPTAPEWALVELAKVVNWLNEGFPAFSVKDGAPRGWVKYPDSYGTSAKQRIKFAEWPKIYGIVGHQHVPENSHGDPGNLNVEKLVSIALTGTAPPEAPPVVIPPVYKDQMDPRSYFIGAKGDHVTWLGQRLEVWLEFLGEEDPYSVGPGPHFTETDRAAVALFQRAQGWTGADADGFPGAQTLTRLSWLPPVAPVGAVEVEAIFRGSYGNHYGGYTVTDKGWWAKRAKGQAALIRAIGSSWHVALEMHEENDMDKKFLSLMADQWALARGKGGNQFYFDDEKYIVLSTKNLLMPGNRWMTKWNVQHLETGVKFWVIGAHLIAGKDKGRVRDQQAQFLVQQIDSIGRGIVCIDRNNAADYEGGPYDRLDDAGWKALRVKSETPVKNANVDSHKDADDDGGEWIDGIHTRQLVRVLEAALIDSGDLADHNWLTGKFSISQEVSV